MHAVQYWLRPGYREKKQKEAKERSKLRRANLTEEEKKRKREDTNRYIKERYREDPKFRERLTSYSLRAQRRKKNESKKAQV